MEATFTSSIFNGDVSPWNVTKVTSMGNMFNYSSFNGDLSEWDVPQVA